MPKTATKTGDAAAAAARPQLILDSDSEAESDEFHSAAEAPLLEGEEHGFKINAEYAKRFEHNKKREELQKLEEKYGSKKRPSRFDDSDDDSDDSSATDEDDTAVLATVALDREIAATLAAIRAKDPRVYDGKTAFYAPIEGEGEGEGGPSPQPTETDATQKPVFLRDYHLQNLLSGADAAADDAPPPKTFAQEQSDLQRSVVREMHAAAAAASDSDSDSDSSTSTPFLTRKRTSPPAPAPAPPSPTLADQNPDAFLDRFLSSRAWATTTSTHAALESDDSDHDATADAFEAAYNLRFEDPDVSARSVLRSYARDAVAAGTVRRGEKSARKKAREEKRARRAREKVQREMEKGRLRRLKMEELEGRLKAVWEAAGLEEGGAEEAQAEVLGRLLEGEWSDGEWEGWMKERFGEEYYGAVDGKIKKPEFGEDIDIADIVPGFEANGEAPTLSADEDDDGDDDGGVPLQQEDQQQQQQQDQEEQDPKTSKKSHRKRKATEKSLKRKLATYITDNYDLPSSPSSSARGFRYRQTTPEAYGLTPLDILGATDQDLNSFVGLKKLASFREAEKKRRDKKRYGKKKRLREWRKEVFGDEEGVVMPAGWKPEGPGAKVGGKGEGEGEGEGEGGKVEEGGEKKKKRRRKGKKV